jgi:NitT/TauT family transport system permease protein
MNKIKFSRANILKISSAFLLFTAWEIAGRVPISFAFPTFFETMEALIAIILNGSIFIAYSDTLRPLFLGIAISAFFGIILGLCIGLSEKTDWFISPIFIIMQAAPLAALIPLLIMVYGVQLTSKVFVVIIMSMPVIVLNTAGAVKNTSSSLQEMCFY